MTANPNEPAPAGTRERQLAPSRSVLHWQTRDYGLDPLVLGAIAEQLHTLMAGPLPGNHIRKIEFDGTNLRIEVGS